MGDQRRLQYRACVPWPDWRRSQERATRGKEPRTLVVVGGHESPSTCPPFGPMFHLATPSDDSDGIGFQTLPQIDPSISPTRSAHRGRFTRRKFTLNPPKPNLYQPSLNPQKVLGSPKGHWAELHMRGLEGLSHREKDVAFEVGQRKQSKVRTACLILDMCWFPCSTEGTVGGRSLGFVCVCSWFCFVFWGPGALGIRVRRRVARGSSTLRRMTTAGHFCSRCGCLYIRRS